MSASLDWTKPDRRPGMVCYLPYYAGNPFQGLLYSRLSDYGFQSAPLYTAGQAAKFVDQVAGGGIELVVHAHWLNAVTSQAEDDSAARQAAAAYLQTLQRTRDLGARILWTVHNVLPHDARYPEAHVALRTEMAALADRVHVMSPRTRELVEPWFELPADKVFEIPHPSYAGVYPDWMPRAQARAELGIQKNTVVFLLLGAIRSYKGLTELMDAFERLCLREPGRYVLLVAGQPGEDEETRRFVERACLHSGVLCVFRRIADQHMQLYLHASDVGVYPYRRSLNSGALNLGLTFGLPAILPAHAGEAAEMDSSFAEVYDANQPDGLLQALLAARRLATDQARAAARAAMSGVAPTTVAHSFGRELREWVDESPAPGG